jgi:hypothetical protein
LEVGCAACPGVASAKRGAHHFLGWSFIRLRRNSKIFQKFPKNSKIFQKFLIVCLHFYYFLRKFILFPAFAYNASGGWFQPRIHQLPPPAAAISKILKFFSNLLAKLPRCL